MCVCVCVFVYVCVCVCGQVVLGGGRRMFFPHGYPDPEGGTRGRNDNLNLVQVSRVESSRDRDPYT